MDSNTTAAPNFAVVQHLFSLWANRKRGFAVSSVGRLSFAASAPPLVKSNMQIVVIFEKRIVISRGEMNVYRISSLLSDYLLRSLLLSARGGLGEGCVPHNWGIAFLECNAMLSLYNLF